MKTDYEKLIGTRNKILQSVFDSLKKKDKNGFAFLTNSHKPSLIPIEFARKFGFKQPVFEVKEAYKVYEEQDVSNMEAWWVKEGLE